MAKKKEQPAGAQEAAETLLHEVGHELRTAVAELGGKFKATSQQIELDQKFLKTEREKLHVIEVELSGYLTRWTPREDSQSTDMRQQLTKVQVNIQNAQDRIERAVTLLDGVEPDRPSLFEIKQ